MDPEVEKIFTLYRKTHNQGVFDVYSAETRLARRVGIITGLPDNYGRGRYGFLRERVCVCALRLCERKMLGLRLFFIE